MWHWIFVVFFLLLLLSSYVQTVMWKAWLWFAFILPTIKLIIACVIVSRNIRPYIQNQIVVVDAAAAAIFPTLVRIHLRWFRILHWQMPKATILHLFCHKILFFTSTLCDKIRNWNWKSHTMVTEKKKKYICMQYLFSLGLHFPLNIFWCLLCTLTTFSIQSSTDIELVVE